MEKVILYTTGCPKCKVLEQKLSGKNIIYETVTDVDKMIAKGFQTAPVLEIDEKVYEFGSAINWINSKDGENV